MKIFCTKILEETEIALKKARELLKVKHGTYSVIRFVNEAIREKAERIIKKG